MEDEEKTCDCQPHWSAYAMKKLVTIAAIAGAVTLLMTGHNEGWGWLIFIAIITS